ncbi:MAG: pantetheine-phosphate adenylyltransferase [Calditrichaeota bacterium]|nr:pantetheine-phosphate adenylyltransferase [Calditrichota bacterium]
MPKVAIYPGTFDPITNGHIDIIERASRIFDKIYVTVARNPAKVPLFTIEERIEMIRESIAHIQNGAELDILAFDGLVVECARQCGASVIIRGLRAISDFEYELQMALMNRRLNEGVTTVFLMPHENYTYLNSTIVKEVASFGGDISTFVPPIVQQRLKEKFQLK